MKSYYETEYRNTVYYSQLSTTQSFKIGSQIFVLIVLVLYNIRDVFIALYLNISLQEKRHELANHVVCKFLPTSIY